MYPTQSYKLREANQSRTSAVLLRASHFKTLLLPSQP
jgi:hypothetical protein